MTDNHSVTHDPQTSSSEIMIHGNVMPKHTSFKYLDSVDNKTRNCDKVVNYIIGVDLLKWRQISGVLCDKHMPPKLKIYTTVRWYDLHIAQKIGGHLSTAEMKIYRMSKFDQIKNQHIRRTLNIHVTVVDLVNNE